jgi:hypothetical protein
MRYIFLTGCLFFNAHLFAQSKAEKEIFKTFIDVCTGYKQLPLQAEIAYTKESNIPLYEDDSTFLKGVFIIEKDQAYIHFGPLEEIINDSLALIIMSNIKQMVLSENTQHVESLMNGMTGLPTNNSSIEKMEQTLDATLIKISDQKNMIRVISKQKVYGTEQAGDEILMTYNSVTKSPLKVETVKRRLIKKTEGQSVSSGITEVAIPDKGKYLLKVDKTTFEFTAISHAENIVMPATLKDRIMKNNEGEYIPVKAFEEYALKLN